MPHGSPWKRRFDPSRILLLLASTSLAAAVACGTGPDEQDGANARASAAASALTASPLAIVTQRYDNGRTGLNAFETTLSPTTLAGGTFGRRAEAVVDGAVYAQPLFVAGGTTNGLAGDTVYVATAHNSVYALDASTLAQRWGVSLMTPTYGADPVTTTVSSSDVRCSDISPEYGITGTPVIDLNTGTLYVVTNTKEGRRGQIVYRLHALDIANGRPRYPSTTITAALAGTGAGSRRGTVTFDPVRHLQRPGLLLQAGGAVYIAFSGHCDVDPYHGWVLGYAYDSATARWSQTTSWVSTPNGAEGGIWMSGAGLTADDAGHAYLSVGNGTFDGSSAFGDSVVRLSLGSLAVTGSFTPYDQATLATKDLDLGSGGVMMVPEPQGGRNVLVTGGKAGTLYLLDAAALGGYATGGNQNLQTLAGAGGGGVYSTPAYWHGTVYVQGKGDALKAFSFTPTGLLTTSPTSQSAATVGFPGTSPVVSADGANGAVVWTVQSDGYASGSPSVLHAYDALDLTRELYSSQWSAADAAGPAVKFVVPLVANGSVYVGASKKVTRYGL